MTWVVMKRSSPVMDSIGRLVDSRNTFYERTPTLDPANPVMAHWTPHLEYATQIESIEEAAAIALLHGGKPRRASEFKNSLPPVGWTTP